jgi:Gas vesicle synthesis protein GvpL/GvpF
MSLLLYCVTKPGNLLNVSRSGVADMPLSRLDRSDLAIFFSHSSAPEPWLRTPLRDSALQFHRVLLDIFKSTAIIPFRFPTILEDQKALTEHIDQHADEYCVLLQKFANKAQLEVRVGFASANSRGSGSGKEFLEERQKRQKALGKFSAALELTTRTAGAEWRERRLNSGFRGFVLLERSHAAEFKHAVAGIPVPLELEARLSGPWPITEFLNLSLDHTKPESEPI